ncbi:hypothetical protein DMH01_32825 [Amycolatopsis sp. WAC 04182]|nr:hypothetical protein DMH01_32825 [Amycolatopsis sp. WAC 04182]
MEGTQKFLRNYVADAGSLDELRDDAARTAAWNPRPIRAALRAIDALISDPPRDGTLSWIVEFDAGWVLDDPSDSGAIEFLYRITEVLREVLDRAQR